MLVVVAFRPRCTVEGRLLASQDAYVQDPMRHRFLSASGVLSLSLAHR